MSRKDRRRTVLISLLLHLLVVCLLLLWKVGFPQRESSRELPLPAGQANVGEKEPMSNALPSVMVMPEQGAEPPMFLSRTGQQNPGGVPLQFPTEGAYRTFLDRLELPKAVQVPPLSMAYADETAVWEVKTFFGERDVITDGATFIEVTSLNPLRYQVLPWFNPEAWGNRRKDRLALPAYRQAFHRIVRELNQSTQDWYTGRRHTSSPRRGGGLRWGGLRLRPSPPILTFPLAGGKGIFA